MKRILSNITYILIIVFLMWSKVYTSSEKKPSNAYFQAHSGETNKTCP